jgi:hypothetical protein
MIKKTRGANMKKVLLLAIALVAVGLTVAPQVQAQDQKRLSEIITELGKLQTQISANGGKATPQEIERVRNLSTEMFTLQGMPPAQAQQIAEGMVQRMQNPAASAGGAAAERQSAEIQRQVEQSQQIQQQQQQAQQEQERQRQEAAMYPGKTRGWPVAAAFRDCKVPALKQPAGTTASYNHDGDRLEVYLSGGNADAVMQDLVRQIEAAAGKKMQHNANGSYWLELRPSGASISENYPNYSVRKQGTVELIIFTPVG